MKKNLTTVALLIATAICYSQTWTLVNDYEREVFGFEDANGNRQDMKYKEAVLVDESNPNYTIVGYAKKGEEELLYGIVDNNTLKVVIPITHKRILVVGKVIHVEDEKDSQFFQNSHEFYTLGLKKIISNPIIDTSYSVFTTISETRSTTDIIRSHNSTKNNFITFMDNEGRQGVVDYTGKVVVPFSRDNTGIFILDSGLFAIESDVQGWNHNTCIMDVAAKVIIPKKRNIWYQDFKKGYFIVNHTNSDGNVEYSAIADITGKEIFTAPQGQDLSFGSDEWWDCDNPLFKASKHTGDEYFYGCYSKAGELVVPFYHEVRLLTCSLFEVSQGKDWDSRKSGVYSIETKKNIIPINYYSITFIKEENIIKAYPIKDNYTAFDLYDLKGNKLKQ